MTPELHIHIITTTEMTDRKQLGLRKAVMAVVMVKAS
jgi:hypothetical protein